MWSDLNCLVFFTVVFVVLSVHLLSSCAAPCACIQASCFLMRKRIGTSPALTWCIMRILSLGSVLHVVTDKHQRPANLVWSAQTHIGGDKAVSC